MRGADLLIGKLVLRAVLRTGAAPTKKCARTPWFILLEQNVQVKTVGAIRPGPKRQGAKRPGPKDPGVKHPGPKCPVPKYQGTDAKRPGPKRPGVKHPGPKVRV